MPKAAAGYARSFFFRGAVELLRELALLAGPLVAAREACMSAGKSFHSVSGRAFWNDNPPAPGLRFGEGPLLLGGAESVPVPEVAARVGGVGACWLRRLAAAAVVLGGIVVATPVLLDAAAPFNPRAEITGPILRLTIQALSGRSLK